MKKKTFINRVLALTLSTLLAVMSPVSAYADPQTVQNPGGGGASSDTGTSSTITDLPFEGTNHFQYYMVWYAYEADVGKNQKEATWEAIASKTQAYNGSAQVDGGGKWYAMLNASDLASDMSGARGGESAAGLAVCNFVDSLPNEGAWSQGDIDRFLSYYGEFGGNVEHAKELIQKYSDGEGTTLPFIHMTYAVQRPGNSVEVYAPGSPYFEGGSGPFRSNVAGQFGASTIIYAVITGDFSQIAGQVWLSTRAPQEYKGHIVAEQFATPWNCATGELRGQAYPQDKHVRAETGMPTYKGTYEIGVTIPDMFKMSNSVQIKFGLNYAAAQGPGQAMTAYNTGTISAFSLNSAAEGSGASISGGGDVIITVPGSGVDKWNALSYQLIVNPELTLPSNDDKKEHSRIIQITSCEITAGNLKYRPTAGAGGTGWEAATKTIYTSARPSKNGPPEEDPEREPFYENGQMAVGRSLIVAGNGSPEGITFDASRAIPSTEFVSVQLGGLVAMYDYAGYMYAKVSGNSYAGLQMSYEDPTSQAIPTLGTNSTGLTRTLKVIASVSNCWGSDNPVQALVNHSHTLLDVGGSFSTGGGEGSIASVGELEPHTHESVTYNNPDKTSVTLNPNITVTNENSKNGKQEKYGYFGEGLTTCPYCGVSYGTTHSSFTLTHGSNTSDADAKPSCGGGPSPETEKRWVDTGVKDDPKTTVDESKKEEDCVKGGTYNVTHAYGSSTPLSGSHDCHITVKFNDGGGESVPIWKPGDKASGTLVADPNGVRNPTPVRIRGVDVLTASVGANAHFAITVTYNIYPADSGQFLCIEYSITASGRSNDGVSVSGGSSSNTAHSTFYTNAKTAAANQKSKAYINDARATYDSVVGVGTLTKNNKSDILCKGYTTGTGTNYLKGVKVQNCANPGTYEYEIDYVTCVDAFVYRSITDVQICGLMKFGIDGVNHISGSVREYNTEDSTGTYTDKAVDGDAPLDSIANASVCSGIETQGAYWRNGEELKGRLIFQGLVKDYIASIGRTTNPTVELDPDYFLNGEYTIRINLTQDHQFAHSVANAVSWNPTVVAADLYRGKNRNAFVVEGYNVYPRVSTPKEVHLYKDAEGDCTYVDTTAAQTPHYSDQHIGSAIESKSAGDLSPCVAQELYALMNAFQASNNGGDGSLCYTAFSISDAIAYGANDMADRYAEYNYCIDDRGTKILNCMAGNTNHHTYVFSGALPVRGGETESYISEKKYRLLASEHGAAGTANKVQLYDWMHDYKELCDEQASWVGLTGDGSIGLGGAVPADKAFAFYCLTSKDFNGYEVGEKPMSYGAPMKTDRLGRVCNSMDDDDDPGVTTFGLTVQAGSSALDSISFDGYWGRQNRMGQVGSEQIKPANGGGSAVTVGGSMAFSGTLTTNNLGVMAISGIPLVSWTANGQWPTGNCYAYYAVIAERNGLPLTPDTCKRCGKNGTAYENIKKSHGEPSTGETALKQVGAGANPGSPAMNEIYIYDPVTVEHDDFVGMQYGSWSPGVDDETPYDQRIDDEGKSYVTYRTGIDDEGNYIVKHIDELTPEDSRLDPSITKPYAIQSRSMYMWSTPIGDFDNITYPDLVEQTNHNEVGCVKTTGQIISGNKYFTKQMNTNRWTQEIVFSYSSEIIFGPGKCYITTYPGEEIAGKYFVRLYESGEAGHRPNYASAPNAGPPVTEYYGNGYKMFQTVNSYEREETMRVMAVAVNAATQTGPGSQIAEVTAGYLNNSDLVNNAAYKDCPIDIVGSIGNISIQDTTDGRWQDYFKDGDFTKPLHIISTPYDIFFKDVIGKTTTSEPKAYGHDSQYSDTYNLDVDQYGGLGGDFDTLPLAPYQNTTAINRHQLFKLGYKAYMSVDTIGNYFGVNQDSVAPLHSSQPDTRQYYVTVKSDYLLYDLATGEFVAIDLWSGASGDKHRIYNGTTGANTTNSVSEVYQNIKLEPDRRNITPRITGIQDTLINEVWDNEKDITYLNADEHYIGSVGSLKLDSRDMYFIGGRAAMTLGEYFTYEDDPRGYVTQTSQQYHYITGLTSTTVATPCFGENNPSQSDVSQASIELAAKYPQGVIIEFQTITAKGEKYTLRTNAAVSCYDTFGIFDVKGPDETPDTDDDDTYIPTGFKIEDVKPHNNPIYPGASIHSAVSGEVVGTIPEYWTPAIIYSLHESAADDRNVEGTH